MEVTDPWVKCFQGFLREHLAGPGGSLGEGLPGDEEELKFFKDVDEEPAASKVLDFLHPLQVDEVSSVPVVVMKETQPELWFNPEGQRVKWWQKYAADCLMPIHASQA
jgi:hypothetical protein